MKVPTIDHQHEKIMIILLCAMLAPQHQTTKNNQTKGIKGLQDSRTTFEAIEF